MTPKLLEDLVVLFAIESCSADLGGDYDEASRLAEIARELRDRAEALKPRAVAHMTTARSAP